MVIRRVLVTLAFVLAAAPTGASAAEPSTAAIDAAASLVLPPKPQSGLSLAVVHNGRLTYQKGFGFRDDGTPDRFISGDNNYYAMPVERGSAPRVATDSRTIYALGSVTRQFTAAAILLLAERNRVGLDEPVSRYVPEFHASPVTIRQLLLQRSGLPDLNTLAFLERVRPLAKHADGSYDDARIDSEIAKLPGHFIPGSRFENSSSNYFVLGTIVERVAREPLATYLNATFFRPLGMTRTAYGRAAASDDVALGYRLDNAGKTWRSYPWDLNWLGGAGALTSTAPDLARWNIALMARRIINPASLGQMWAGLDAGRGQGSYAMGFIEDSLGSHRYLWHNGQVGGFHAYNVIFPDDDLAFTLLSNNQDAQPEYVLPHLAMLYFPLNGIDRVLPHSAAVVVEASLALALGALAIAIVAMVTFKRFIVVGNVAALLALLIGFFAPTFIGYVWGGIAALIPIAGYLCLLRFGNAFARRSG